MPKIAKKQLKSKQIFARLIAGSTSQSEVNEGVTSGRNEALTTSERREAAGTVRRSLETVERISHPPEGIQISGNIN
jgi:hypothetical protein